MSVLEDALREGLVAQRNLEVGWDRDEHKYGLYDASGGRFVIHADPYWPNEYWSRKRLQRSQRRGGALMADTCPMGCGGMTDDVAGGPCSSCWDAVPVDPRSICGDDLALVSREGHMWDEHGDEPIPETAPKSGMSQAWQMVSCSKCGTNYQCTPSSDYYNATTTEDGVCEACLLGYAGMNEARLVAMRAVAETIAESGTEPRP